LGLTQPVNQKQNIKLTKIAFWVTGCNQAKHSLEN
jgi:hypothetical protein